MDHYKTLGVDPDATHDEIKKGYREKASEMHPDHGGESRDFQAVREAYDVLSDPVRRELYDAQRLPCRFGSLTDRDLAKLAEAMIANLHDGLFQLNVADADTVMKNLQKDFHRLLSRLRDRAKAGYMH